ncbi:MAG: EI24 domain-containing protein [Rhodospirillaceae bacterium]|nr:EI24 domain-containing protein [Rhodospirillaceae bacterium]
MIHAFTLGFLQLKDPRILRLVVISVLCTIVVYAALFAGVGWLLRTTTVTELPWLDTLFDAGAGVSAAILAWLLFPGIVTGVVGVFLDDVVAAVEARHYAQKGAGRDVPTMEIVGSSLKLMGATIGLNLLMLPLYVLLVFLPPLNLVLYYLVNGRLLGREYFETVALRRLDARAMAEMRQSHRWTVWAAGALTTALLTVPFVNMVAPVVGTAAMVHLFHKLTVRT